LKKFVKRKTWKNDPPKFSAKNLIELLKQKNQTHLVLCFSVQKLVLMAISGSYSHPCDRAAIPAQAQQCHAVSSSFYYLSSLHGMDRQTRKNVLALRGRGQNKTSRGRFRERNTDWCFRIGHVELRIRIHGRRLIITQQRRPHTTTETNILNPLDVDFSKLSLQERSDQATDPKKGLEYELMDVETSTKT
jgi:hypothetical protein